LIEEASAKIRTGPPEDDPADCGLPIWAGVLPLEVTARSALPDLRFGTGVDLPQYLHPYTGRASKQEKT
jgi:uncharacterized protein